MRMITSKKDRNCCSRLEVAEPTNIYLSFKEKKIELI